MAIPAKLTVEAHGALADPLKTLYKQKGDVFVLDLEGVDDIDAALQANTRLGEFRTNNITLTKEIEKLRADMKAFEGIDPVKYKEATDKLAALEKKGVKKDDDIENIIKSAVEAATAPLRSSLETITKKEQETAQRLARETFEKTVTTAAMKFGVHESALPDIVARAERDGFRFIDGAIKAVGENNIPRYEADGTERTLDSYFKTALPKDAPHLFKPSGGSGHQGGGGGNNIPAGARVIVNPTAKEMGALAADIAAGKVVVQMTE